MILERLLYSFVSSVVSAAVSSFGRIKFNKIAMIVATTTEEEPKILLIPEVQGLINNPQPV